MDAGDQRENRGKLDEGKQKQRFGHMAADQLGSVLDFKETPHHHHQMVHHSLSGEGPICDVVPHQTAHSVPLRSCINLMLQTQNNREDLLTSISSPRMQVRRQSEI